jgi:hypothetical protein
MVLFKPKLNMQSRAGSPLEKVASELLDSPDVAA